LSVDSRRSTKKREAVTVAVLSSLDSPSGNAPAALMCVPGASHSSSTRGSLVEVAVQTMSAPSTASST